MGNNLNKRKRRQDRRIEKRRIRNEKIKNKRYRISTVIFIISFIIMLASGTYILKYYLDINKAKKEVNLIKEDIEKLIDNKNGDELDQKIDLSTFKEKNADSKFILNFPILDIKNVVLQGKDNDFYLNHDFNKNYSLSGWLFADYRNKLDGEDKNVVVYGHNMRDGATMFSSLFKFIDQNFLNSLKEEDKIIEIIDESSAKKFKIFSVYQAKDKDIDLQIPYTENNLINYMRNMKNKSIFNFNEVIQNEKEMLTLITCGRTNEDRVVIHAKLINEQKYK